MTIAVFLDPDLTDMPVGARYQLTGAEAHHAVAVRRMGAGEMIDIVDGNGLRVRGQIIATETRPASATIEVRQSQREATPAVQIILVQALATGGRDELAIEMATELGAMGIIPWHAKRCTATWPGKKAAKRQERWQAITTAATKQSRRAHIPWVRELHTTAQLCALAATMPVVILDADAPTALVDMPIRPGPLAVVIGPEGGIDPAELSQLRAAGATTARLGGTILRTSTAAATAVGLIAARSGAWGERLQ